MNTRILFLYPFVFHRVRRVDSRYAYLVTQSGYVPLRRREGCFSTIWRYESYTSLITWNTRYGDKEYSDKNYRLYFKTLDDMSNFFQTQMLKEEYEDVVEESFDELELFKKIVNSFIFE